MLEVLPPIAAVLTPVITWFLVVLGWMVVSDLNEQRERRKQNEQRLEAVRNAVDVIEDLAVAHHTDGYQEKRRDDLVRKIKLTGVECSHLERIKAIGSDWRLHNANVRRSITAENFEHNGYTARGAKSDLIFNIEQSCDHFRSFLMKNVESSATSHEKLRDTLRRVARKF